MAKGYKITEADHQMINLLRQQGVPVRHIAELFDVHFTTIYYHLENNLWKSVEPVSKEDTRNVLTRLLRK